MLYHFHKRATVQSRLSTCTGFPFKVRDGRQFSNLAAYRGAPRDQVVGVQLHPVLLARADIVERGRYASLLSLITPSNRAARAYKSVWSKLPTQLF